MGRGDELLTTALFMLAKQGVWQMPEDDREMKCGAITSERRMGGRRENCCRVLHRVSLDVGAFMRVDGDVRPQNDCQFAFVTLD